jgi:hypothetical protein
MSWADIETAVLAAVKHASGVPLVRLSTGDRGQDTKQLIEVSFELDVLDPPETRTTESGEGLDVGAVPELQIVARLDVVSYTHTQALSAYAIAYRLLGRSSLDATLAFLDDADVVLDRVRGATPIKVEADQRALSAMTLVWEMRTRYHETEGAAPAGLAPREYFDRVEVTEDETPLVPRVLAPVLAPEALLELADWRSLWLGTQTDLVGGRALEELVAGALHNVPQEIGSDVLDRATVFGSTVASIKSTDPDAGVIPDGSVLVLLLRAPAAAGQIAARSLDGSAGWVLSGAADGALELSAPAAGLTFVSVTGLLDGATWLLVALGHADGDLTLYVHGESPEAGACTAAQLYEDEPLTLGAQSAEVGLSGLSFALLGETASDDPAALLADLAAALGL